MTRMRDGRTRARHISDVEKTSIADLVAAHSDIEIRVSDGRIATLSATRFLKTMEEVSEALRIPQACRQYRDRFTVNYKMLFPDGHRHYRLDIFEACLDQRDYMWVNGDKFEFSNKTLHSAVQMQEAFANLRHALQSECLYCDDWKFLKQLRTLLARLDSTWAAFEKAYISELIAIEANARRHLTSAIKKERSLASAETNRRHVDTQRRRFVHSVNNLNSIANSQGKGRADLDSSILEEALLLLKSTKSGAGYVLARDVVSSFEALRSYLQKVSQMFWTVNPQLFQNPGLVARLVDWETSWEVFAKYRSKMLLDAVSACVMELQEVQEVAPSLKEMCDNCDAELFLCVPRLLWLRFLEDPSACGELLKIMLPHRFTSTLPQDLPTQQKQPQGADVSPRGQGRACFEDTPVNINVQEDPGPSCLAEHGLGSSPAFPMSDELSKLRERYQCACQHILRVGEVPGQIPPRAHFREKPGTPSVAWEILARRAVVGTDGAEELYKLLLPSHPEAKSAIACVEELMRDLERWSMELQRHEPEEWNQCSSILLQCFMGESEKEQTPTEFQV